MCDFRAVPNVDEGIIKARSFDKKACLFVYDPGMMTLSPLKQPDRVWNVHGGLAGNHKVRHVSAARTGWPWFGAVTPLNLDRANGRGGFGSQTAADPPGDPWRTLKSSLWVL